MKKILCLILILWASVAFAGPHIDGGEVGTATVTPAGGSGDIQTNNGSGGLGSITQASLKITKGYQYIDAGQLVPGTSSGLQQMGTPASSVDYIAFSSSSAQYAYFKWVPPDDWDAGTIKAKFYWAAGEAWTDAHTVTWGLNGFAYTDGGSTSTTFGTGEVTVNDAYATGDETGPKLKITSATAAITIQNTPAVGKMALFRVSGLDADSKLAWLLGLKIEYGKTGATPAAW